MEDIQITTGPNHTKSALAALVIAGLIAVIPFVLPHHGQAVAFYGEWTAFALGVAACFPFARNIFWSPLQIPQSAIWLFALVILIAAQTLVVTPVYVTQPLVPGLYITWATLLVILGFWIRQQLGIERAITVFAWMLVLGGVLSSAIGVVQYFDVSGKFSLLVDQKSVVTVGNTGQRNHFAAHITFASFALIYLYAAKRIHLFPAIGLLALFGLMLTASSSRSPVIYIVAGLLLALVSYRATKTPIHRRLLQGVALLLALFLVFQFLVPFLNDWLNLFLASLGFDVSSFDTAVARQRNAAEGFDLRLSEWHKSWWMFMESPLWGIGVGNYGWYSFNYQALPEFSGVAEGVLFSHSHNLIMQVLAELGILGLLALLVMAIAWIRQILPDWKNPSCWLILVLLIVLLIHSNLEYPLWFSYFLGIAAILLGLGSRTAQSIKFTPWLGQVAAIATQILSVAILAITFLGVQEINVNRLFMTATPEEHTATMRAVSKNPILTPWAEAAIALHGRPGKDVIEQRLSLSTRVFHYRPNSSIVNRQIYYLDLSGRINETSELMKKAFLVYPADFTNFACSMKQAPFPEAKQLWKHAEQATNNAIKCETS